MGREWDRMGEGRTSRRGMKGRRETQGRKESRKGK